MTCFGDYGELIKLMRDERIKRWLKDLGILKREKNDRT